MKNVKRFFIFSLVLCMVFSCTALPVYAEDPDDPTQTPACAETGEHVPGEWTAGENGRHTSVCTLCGEPMEADCVWGEETQSLGDGTHVRVCTVCGGTSAAEECVWGKETQALGDGTHVKVCTVCGGTSAPEECVWGEERQALGNGTHVRVCTVCGGRSVPEDCVYNEGTQAKPTQTTPGTLTRVCRVCGGKQVTETSPAECDRKQSMPLGDVTGDGNVYSEDARLILRAAVSLEGIKKEYLPAADLNEDGDITSADARLALRTCLELDPVHRHDPVITAYQAPGCTKDGSMTWRCAYCGVQKQLHVPEAGHSWTEATPTKAKYCKVCGVKATGFQRVNGKTYYYRADGTVPAGKTLIYASYQGKTAWWYLNDGMPDPTARTALRYDGSEWIVTGGTATKVTTEAQRTLYRAFGEVEKATTPDMTKEQKLRACFLYCKKNYKERRPRTPHYTGVDWPIVYANDMFVGSGGNCFSYAAAFAYMAKAIGYENVYCCNSGGHGWAEINGLVYDPEWSKKDGLNAVTYYALSYDTKTDVAYKQAISARLDWMHVKI